MEEYERTALNVGPLVPPAAAGEDLAYFLHVAAAGQPGRRVAVGARPLTVGRDAARDVVVDDAAVSRWHLQVSLQGDRVVVEDRQSTNGTFLDGARLVGAAELREGSRVQIGQHTLTLERRSRRDVEEREALDRDLDKASQYVHSLLPAPLADGPVRTDWCYQPSAQLGGDAFGCDRLDADTFVFYLIDVSGHGVGAAMHSVSVLNVLRQRALPRADLTDPVQVLSDLNAMFQMDRHDGMYFTMWYGAYDCRSRRLRYACAGHHAAYLVRPDRQEATPLRTHGLMIGAAPEARYRADDTVVPPGGVLYVFSDGVFEIVTKDQRQWRVGDFVPLLLDAPVAGVSESRRLFQAVTAAARPGPLDDDFSLVVVTLP